MRRTGIMGLCLAGALALGGVGAISASALPEVGRCQAKAGGRYSDSACTVKAAKGAGKYEWVRGAVKRGLAGSGGESVFETASGTSVICKTESSTGEYREVSGAIKEVAHVVLTFTGCELPILAGCESKGAAEDEIVTNPLKGPLGYISGEATKAPVVGQELTPETPKGAFVEFSCGFEAVKIKVGEGSGKGHDCIIGALSAVNVMSTTVGEAFTGKEGMQIPNHFQKTPTKICNLESSANGGTFERTKLVFDTTVKYEEPLEVKA
jgi:hypothetical protein